MTDAVLYLASTSPRRLQLLQQVGLSPQVCAPDIDEQVRAAEYPEEYVMRMASEKADACCPLMRDDQRWGLLAADTTVVLEQSALGKPVDRADFMHTMQRLSGRSHRVLSAVAWRDHSGRRETVMAQTEVWFRTLREGEAAAYWATGEPADKAGGYAIQGRAAAFVEKIEGNFSTVMGLPLFETLALMPSSWASPLPTEVETS